MNFEEKLKLIKRNTLEILTEKDLKKLLKEKEHPTIYLGTSITGRPHIGYFAWVQKLADCLKAGFKIKILFADVHGALDNCPWKLLKNRYKYYIEVISGMLKAYGVNLDDVEFVKGSDIQIQKDYIMDLYKLSSIVSLRYANKAASDVVKMGDNPKLSGLIYPLMQVLDEVYLDVDCQLGARDQRKILVLAREFLPKIGYKKRVEILTPFIRGLSKSGKMSSSIEHTKIDLLDDLKTVKSKLKKAYCKEGDIENGVLDFAKTIIMTIKKDNNKQFIIDRPEKWGGTLKFKTAKELEKSFVNKDLHPLDLKKALALEIDNLLKPIRARFKDKQDLIKKAYPK